MLPGHPSCMKASCPAQAPVQSKVILVVLCPAAKLLSVLSRRCWWFPSSARVRAGPMSLPWVAVARRSSSVLGSGRNQKFSLPELIARGELLPVVGCCWINAVEELSRWFSHLSARWERANVLQHRCSFFLQTARFPVLLFPPSSPGLFPNSTSFFLLVLHALPGPCPERGGEGACC